MPLTLAEGWVEFIIPVVFFIFWIISAINSQANKNAPKTPPRSRGSGDAGRSTSGDRAKSVRERLNELAEMRRRQLQEMARQKEQGQSPARPAPRAQEKPRSVIVLEEVAPTEDELARQRQQAVQRAADELQRRNLEAIRQREEQQRQLERQRRAAEAKRAAQFDRDEASRMAVHRDAPGADEQVHRHVADAAMPERRKVHPLVAKLDRQRAREAIILMEVLGKPLSMRNPWEIPMER